MSKQFNIVTIILLLLLAPSTKLIKAGPAEDTLVAELQKPGGKEIDKLVKRAETLNFNEILKKIYDGFELKPGFFYGFSPAQWKANSLPRLIAFLNNPGIVKKIETVGSISSKTRVHPQDFTSILECFYFSLLEHHPNENDINENINDFYKAFDENNTDNHIFYYLTILIDNNKLNELSVLQPALIKRFLASTDMHLRKLEEIFSFKNGSLSIQTTDLDPLLQILTDPLFDSLDPELLTIESDSTQETIKISFKNLKNKIKKLSTSNPSCDGSNTITENFVTFYTKQEKQSAEDLVKKIASGKTTSQELTNAIDTGAIELQSFVNNIISTAQQYTKTQLTNIINAIQKTNLTNDNTIIVSAGNRNIPITRIFPYLNDFITNDHYDDISGKPKISFNDYYENALSKNIDLILAEIATSLESNTHFKEVYKNLLSNAQDLFATDLSAWNDKYDAEIKTAGTSQEQAKNTILLIKGISDMVKKSPLALMLSPQYELFSRNNIVKIDLIYKKNNLEATIQEIKKDLFDNNKTNFKIHAQSMVDLLKEPFSDSPLVITDSETGDIFKEGEYQKKLQAFNLWLMNTLNSMAESYSSISTLIMSIEGYRNLLSEETSTTPITLTPEPITPPTKPHTQPPAKKILTLKVRKLLQSKMEEFKKALDRDDESARIASLKTIMKELTDSLSTDTLTFVCDENKLTVIAKENYGTRHQSLLSLLRDVIYNDGSPQRSTLWGFIKTINGYKNIEFTMPSSVTTEKLDDEAMKIFENLCLAIKEHDENTRLKNLQENFQKLTATFKDKIAPSTTSLIPHQETFNKIYKSESEKDRLWYLMEYLDEAASSLITGDLQSEFKNHVKALTDYKEWRKEADAQAVRERISDEIENIKDAKIKMNLLIKRAQSKDVINNNPEQFLNNIPTLIQETKNKIILEEVTKQKNTIKVEIQNIETTKEKALKLQEKLATLCHELANKVTGLENISPEKTWQTLQNTYADVKKIDLTTIKMPEESAQTLEAINAIKQKVENIYKSLVANEKNIADQKAMINDLIIISDISKHLKSIQDFCTQKDIPALKSRIKDLYKSLVLNQNNIKKVHPYKLTLTEDVLVKALTDDLKEADLKKIALFLADKFKGPDLMSKAASKPLIFIPILRNSLYIKEWYAGKQYNAAPVTEKLIEPLPQTPPTPTTTITPPVSTPIDNLKTKLTDLSAALGKLKTGLEGLSTKLNTLKDALTTS